PSGHGPAPAHRGLAPGPADAQAPEDRGGAGRGLCDLASGPGARLHVPRGRLPGRPDLGVAGPALAPQERQNRAPDQTLTGARDFSILTLLIRFFSTSTTVSR